MTTKNIVTILLSLIVSTTFVSAKQFKNLQSVETFVHSEKWELVTKDKDSTVVEFANNHTLTDGKAVQLGNKIYRFWSVAKHPTQEDSFVLRVHSKKTAGWFTFSWDAKQQAWTSKHWPKVKIKKK